MKLLSRLYELWQIRNSKSFICALRKKGVKIGNGCIIRYPHTARIDVTRPALVTIGDNVFCAPYVGIYTAGHPVHPYPRNLGIEYNLPVTIGDNVWIGDKVSILSNVTIGKGSVIACNAVVTKDVPPYSVVGGVPAKVIKQISPNT